MANVLISETNLTNIANAIREKNGKSTVYKPREMAAAITALSIGNDIEPFTLSGNCSYLFENGKLTWLIDKYKDRITTNDISSCVEMFRNCGMTNIPLNLYFHVPATPDVDTTGMFRNCETLMALPTLEYHYTFHSFKGNYIFYNCRSLRDISSNFLQTYQSKFSEFYLSRAFTNCHSLRSISNILKWRRTDTSATGVGNYYEMFMNCYALDSIENLPVVSGYGVTTPGFMDTFTNCYRLKDLTFERKNNTTVYEVGWDDGTNFGTVDLSSVGYVNITSITPITGFNSGITADKEVINDTTYQALKNDPDWFTKKVDYSRYNKTSAIKTISSLPKVTKATIKFKGAAGALTDGGAINTMTEEELAVATAKGWTVAFV